MLFSNLYVSITSLHPTHLVKVTLSISLLLERESTLELVLQFVLLKYLSVVADLLPSEDAQGNPGKI